MVDAWINCNKCGNRYGSWTSQCPQCGATNGKQGGLTTLGKNQKIAFVIVAVVLVAVFAIGANAIWNAPPSKELVAAAQDVNAKALALLDACSKDTTGDCQKNGYIANLVKQCNDAAGTSTRQYLTYCDDPRLITVLNTAQPAITGQNATGSSNTVPVTPAPGSTAERDARRNLSLFVSQTYTECITNDYYSYSDMSKSDCQEKMNEASEYCKEFQLSTCDEQKQKEFNGITAGTAPPANTNAGLRATEYWSQWPNDHILLKVYPSNMMCGATMPYTQKLENGTVVATGKVLVQQQDIACQKNSGSGSNPDLHYWNVDALPSDIVRVIHIPAFDHPEGIRQVENGRVVRYLDVSFTSYSYFDMEMTVEKLAGATYVGEPAEGTLTISIEQLADSYPDCREHGDVCEATKIIYENTMNITKNDYKCELDGGYYSCSYEKSFPLSEIKGNGESSIGQIVIFTFKQSDGSTLIAKTGLMAVA